MSNNVGKFKRAAIAALACLSDGKPMAAANRIFASIAGCGLPTRNTGDFKRLLKFYASDK